MHTPRKRFSQNFLQDAGIIRRIVEAIHPQPGERLVEIGPGLGALTEPLLAAAGKLEVVEIDRDIVRRLRSQHPPERLAIHEGDALEQDFAAFGRDLRIVGNLPYHISTPLLFHLGDAAGEIRDCHFMLQREVVQRMGAEPGSADYGRLSVMLQYRWEVEALFDVPPEAFHPQPKVWSSIVRMRPFAALPVAAADERIFAEIVSAAFGQRRKTLRNALSLLLDAEGIARAGVDPGARGETLDVAAFARIADVVADRRG
jgi:16S rRNA (adenine1518-N6/adenine1519-N6)-dimethyltransferase